MHLPSRPFGVLLVLAVLFVVMAGCDSNGDRRIGFFQADVRGNGTTQLEGSAHLVLETDDSDAPSSFEIMLFSESGPSGEITIESAPDSGAPQEAIYAVEQTFTGASPLVVLVEFNPDRFDSSMPTYVGETGTVEITNVAETTVEGQFNLDAVDGSTGERVIIDGQFTAQVP